MAGRIAICDTDYAYALAVMKYINTNYGNELIVSVYSDVAVLLEQLSFETYDLFLVAYDYYEDWSLEPVCWLVEEDFYETLSVIYKYQNADNIVALVKKCIADNHRIRSQVYSFDAVCSPIGRCGKTKYAISLCEDYKSAICISLEETPQDIQENSVTYNEKRMKSNRFIYYLITKNKSIVEELRDVTVIGDNYYMQVWASINDLLAIDADSLAWFRNLLKETQYSRAVMDLGYGTCFKDDELLVFDTIYVPYIEDEAANRKMNYFRRIHSDLSLIEINMGSRICEI